MLLIMLILLYLHEISKLYKFWTLKCGSAWDVFRQTWGYWKEWLQIMSGNRQTPKTIHINCCSLRSASMVKKCDIFQTRVSYLHSILWNTCCSMFWFSTQSFVSFSTLSFLLVFVLSVFPLNNCDSTFSIFKLFWFDRLN